MRPPVGCDIVMGVELTTGRERSVLKWFSALFTLVGCGGGFLGEDQSYDRLRYCTLHF